MKPILDDDGREVRAGDWVHFGYGTPGVGVRGEVTLRGGRLVVLTPGHKPTSCPLSTLRQHVGHFWIVKKPESGDWT